MKTIKKHIKKHAIKWSKRLQTIVNNVVVSVISGLLIYFIMTNIGLGEAEAQANPINITNTTYVPNNSDIVKHNTILPDNIESEYQGLKVNKYESIVLFGGRVSFGLMGVNGDVAKINFNLNKEIRQVIVADSIPFEVSGRKYNLIIREVNVVSEYVVFDIYRI